MGRPSRLADSLGLTAVLAYAFALALGSLFLDRLLRPLRRLS